MISDYLRYSVLAILTFVAVALAGCSSEADGPEPVDPSDEDQVILRLNVSFGSDATSSRADNDPNAPYENPTGDFESVATLRVIILHADRTVEANRMVTTQPNGKPVNDNLEFVVSSNEVKWIYLIANEAALQSPVNGYTVSQWLDTFVKKTPAVTLPADVMRSWTTGYSADQIVSDNVVSSLFKGSLIPQTEVFRVNTALTGDETTGSTDEGEESSGSTSVIVHRLKEVDLFMIRAAAKATFIFDLSGFTGMGGNITGARILGLNQNEYVFPRYTTGTSIGSATYSPAKYDGNESAGVINDQVENGERYIAAFDSPADNPVISYTLSGQANFTPIRMAATSGRTNTRGPVYFPESRSTLAEGAYTVQIQVDGNRWLDAQPLKDNVLSFDGAQAIARNTHLRINITVGEDNSLMYTVNVAPWTPETYTFDYTENIGLAEDGKLEIIEGTYRSIDEETGRIVLNNYPAVLKGKFNIATPAGARWDAYLITQTGEPNAIQFVVPAASGTGTEYTDHISGMVDPTPVNFSIAPVSTAGTATRSARLEVIVTLANGTTISATEMINGDQFGEKVDFVTFIQNPQ